MVTASIILAELRVESEKGVPDADALVRGHGVYAPGVVIPNAWWDRPRLITDMEVDRPKPGGAGNGMLTVAFRGRCTAAAATVLCALMDAGAREAVEREIVPALLEGMALWQTPPPDQPMPLATGPFGKAVAADAAVQKWAKPAGLRRRSRTAVIHDLVRLAVGQDADVDRDTVLREAEDLGILASGHFAALVAKIPRPSAPGPVAPRPARVRVVDT